MTTMTDAEIIERAEEVFALYGGDAVTQVDLDRMNRLLRIGAKVIAVDEATVAGMRIIVNPDTPPGAVVFKDTDGKELGRIVNLDDDAALASVGE